MREFINPYIKNSLAERFMKEVIVIIRPNMYFKTKEKLIEAGFNAMTTKEILGRGKKIGKFMVNDGNDSEAIGMDLIAKKMIQIYVRAEDVDSLVKAVLEVNSSANHGDGKIFISTADEVVRIRTNQKGEDAIM